MAVVKRTQVINKLVFQTVVDEIGNGTRFELEIRGFGKVQQELHEFDRNKQVRPVPSFKLLAPSAVRIKRCPPFP